MKVCKDCKDGYYYPFNGPREQCQTCKAKPKSVTASQDLDAFVQNVVSLFCEKLSILLFPQVKSFKDPNNQWNLIAADTGCTMGIPADEMALIASKNMFALLGKAYLPPIIAFEDQLNSHPPSVHNCISKIATYGKVSASVAMSQVSSMLKFHFQIKVSP